MAGDAALLAIGAFLAALVIGSAGFAFAVVVTGVWIHVLPPVELVFLASICATALHVVSVWQFRRDIEYRLLLPFLAGGILGVPLGVYALQHVDTAVFRHWFGGFMIVYSAYMLRRPVMPQVRLAPAVARLADAAIGWLSGVAGGLAFVHGTVATIWCGLRGWDKRRARCVYQPFILFTGFLVMIIVGARGNMEASRFGFYALICLPALAAGLWAGLRVFDWVSEERFRQLVLWLILASGIALQF